MTSPCRFPNDADALVIGVLCRGPVTQHGAYSHGPLPGREALECCYKPAAEWRSPLWYEVVRNPIRRNYRKGAVGGFRIGLESPVPGTRRYSEAYRLVDESTPCSPNDARQVAIP